MLREHGVGTPRRTKVPAGEIPKGQKRAARLEEVSSQLQELVKMMEVSLDIRCPELPRFSSYSEIKSFCCDLIEGGEHPWKEWMSESPTKRLSVRASLFLFRKVIPSITLPGAEEEAVANCIRRLSEPSPPVKAEFYSFAREEIRRIFNLGWDEGYEREVDNMVLSTSSCLESRTSKGGARGFFRGVSDSKGLWRTVCMGESDLIPDRTECKVVPIPDGGKVRVVTIPGYSQHKLRPLHHTLYNHLSRKKWLLRGDATPGRFGEFTASTHEGSEEVFVSGDYESATDNIPLELYQFLLKEVRKTSRAVPESIWNAAEKWSACDLIDGDGKRWKQRRGQLMGSYLSFPFLCLTNYLIFRFFVRRRVPVRINGDDIVFRATRAEAERWADGVASCGLVLSKGKTLVEERYFSLNSTFFRAWRGGVKLVPVIRGRAYFSIPRDLNGLVGAYDSAFVGFGGQPRNVLRSMYLRKHSSHVYMSGRSVTRGLGLCASVTVLRMAGLIGREKYYLSLAKEEPIPVSPGDILWELDLKGWQRVPVRLLSKESRVDAKVDQVAFQKHLVAQTWTSSFKTTPKEQKESYWDRVRETGVNLSPEWNLSKGKGGDLLRKWCKSGPRSQFSINRHQTPIPKRRWPRGPYLWLPERKELRFLPAQAVG